ncbi:MAG: MFS transporter [Deltaproteobacteria bacterium]|nr:MFS transporter [Deltaproteobacteria bacterium]
MLNDLSQTARQTFHHDFRSAILFGVFGGLLLPFVAIIGRKIGASEFQVALLTATPFIANIFALFWTEDIFGKGRIWYVVWPGAIGRALILGMFFVSTPFNYTLLIFFYMVITAIPFPSYAYVMKANYPDDQRGHLMSYVRLGNAGMWILASAIGGWVLEKGTGNYRYLFPVAAVFGILSAFEFGRIKMECSIDIIKKCENDKERMVTLSHLAAPFKNRVFRQFLMSYSLFEFGLLLALPVYPLVLVDEVHIPNMVAGIYGSIVASFGLAGFFFWGRFIDRHSTGRTLSAVCLTASLIPLIYLSSRNLWVLGAAHAFSGLTYAAMELIGYVVITRMSSNSDVPRYMAVHIALSGVRGGIAPFLGTALMSAYGASSVFGLSLFLILFGFFLAVSTYGEKL